ncbi:MAG: SpaA isopeptide-forming pilin-related protein, partial [Lactococcus cremoris]
SEGQPLSGAVFKVVNESGKVIKEGLTSDKVGKVAIDGLAPGDYSFIETQAPTGYILNTEKVDFTISDKEEGQPKVVTASDNFVNYQGSAELIKHDSEGQPLSGAVFKVVNESGEMIKEGLTSDKDGKVKIDDLVPGNYSFIETQAPAGYILNTAKADFTISDEEKNKPKVVMASDNFINYQGSAELVKVSESGEKLSGAVFKVVDTSKNEVVLKGLKSNSDGIIKANNLKPGKYAFVEEKAPTGYQLSQETKTFEIVNESENKPEMVKVGKFVNRKLIIPRQKSELPKTGEQENRFLPISGLAIFIFGIYVTFKRQKLKNK